MSLNHEAVELLFDKCPFCGNIPNVLMVPDNRYQQGEKGWVVECKDMGCIFRRSIPHQALNALRSDWNKRDMEKPTTIQPGDISGGIHWQHRYCDRAREHLKGGIVE
jgi:hypothetical protein